MLDGIMFGNFPLYPFLDEIVRAFSSVRPHILDVVIISVVVKQEIFEVVGRGRTNNWMVLCDLHQDLF